MAKQIKTKKGKVSRNITLSKEIHDYVVELGEKPTENRNFSNMAETLIIEAKNHRAKK